MVPIDVPASRDATASRDRASAAPLDFKRPPIGVLAVQGDVSEHMAMLEDVGARARPVKRPADLESVEGLVLPGGESTALRRLLDYEGLLESVLRRLRVGERPADMVDGPLAAKVGLGQHQAGVLNTALVS